MLLTAGCGGQSSSSAPTAPTTSASKTPTITVTGAAEVPNEIPFAFPTSVTLGGSGVASIFNGILGGIWSAVMPAVHADTLTFSFAIDFPLTPSPTKQLLIWDFGDGSKSTYGCNQVDANALCDSLKRGLSVSHTYSFGGNCNKAFNVVVTAETTTGTVTKTIPVTITKTPVIALTSDAAVQLSGDGGFVQVNWTLGACSSDLVVQPDVPWITRSGTCTSQYGGMIDVGEGCGGTSGMGTYGRTWKAGPNASASTRVGHINLSVVGGNRAQVTITQLTAPPR
jgi:hypothetical protein